ncbi:kinesin-like protein KIF19 [Molossus molossus]|uniref:kinesin-like protein KIF19 n=1 Tax=Molossus molossus TaxID=27622 RepID=UPI001746F0FD|nr:kinesin-like protein KIF19 [Molossus molossus]
MEEVGPKDQQLMVALRIRPLSDTELEEGATVIAHRVGGQTVVLMDPSEDPEDTLRTHRSREKTFTFDTVFDQHASQEDVYRATTQQLVAGVISGYNATVFAYGPSGTGKTYTMLGMDTEPGIYLQTLTDLFRAIEDTRDHMDCRVSMSYLEIYNEVIRDLLNPSSGLLDLREDARGSIQIAGVTEVCTSNAQEIMQLLGRGNRQRTQEPTASNRASSRSHAVLQVTVLQQSRGADSAEGVRVGRLFMVDLAGSERASQTQNRGKRMQEGAHINRSLLALGNCINALSEKGGSRSHYVNFRDSKLTRLLKDALGGNSWTVMIAHISPASTSFEESRTTLLYADRAKNIKTRVKRNLLNVSCPMDQYTDVIADLRGQIEHLRSRIDRQDRTGSEPGLRDPPVTMPAAGTEEDSHLRMDRLRAQLVGTFQEQQEAGRGLVALEHTSVELHVDMSRLLLAIAHWEQETHHRGQDRTPERDTRQAVADADGDEGESAEPREVALAREEVNMLLAKQRKTATLKAGLQQRLASAGRKASQLEKLLHTQAISEDQREVLRLLRRAHELELENAALQASHLRRDGLLCQQDLVLQRCHQHRLLCEQIVREQQQLMQDGGVQVPAELGEHHSLFSRELGEGSLDHLWLLRSVTASSLRDGSAVNTPLRPEEPRGDQPDDRKDRPWGARLELPPVQPETDSLEPGPPRTVAGDLEDMAASTRGIALIAATRRSKVQDPGGGSSRSFLHLPEELALDSRDPSPADSRWPRASPGRDCSVEGKARRKRSPCCTCAQLGLQPVGADATARCPPATLTDTTVAAPRGQEDQSPRARRPASMTRK